MQTEMHRHIVHADGDAQAHYPYADGDAQAPRVMARVRQRAQRSTCEDPRARGEDNGGVKTRRCERPSLAPPRCIALALEVMHRLEA